MTAQAGSTRIETTRFGQLEIAEDAIIRFPRPLYGLEEARAYCLLAHDERGCFQWLQAADAPSIAMLVTDPFLFFSDYEIEIPDSAAGFLQAEAVSDVSIYTPITVSADRGEIYANLLGPVVINRRRGIGMQIIQDAARYSTRHRVAAGCGSRDKGAAAPETSATESQLAPGDPETERRPYRATAGSSA